MKTYSISLRRITSEYQTLCVQADNKEQARKIAEEMIDAYTLGEKWSQAEWDEIVIDDVEEEA